MFFKLSRRKGYQRSGGHRQTIQLLRIDRIVHEVSEADFKSQGALLQIPKESHNIII
ncbi:MAG: hypothetical protein ACK56F_26130 [bacterium]